MPTFTSTLSKLNVKRLTLIAMSFALLILSTPASAHEYYAKSFKVIHPWALATEEGATNAAVYLKIEEISASDRLVSATSPLAEKVELRKVELVGSKKPKDDSSAAPTGIKLSGVDIPLGGNIDLQADGVSLMLINLKQPLQWQRSYLMTLVFEKSGEIQVMISIGSH